MEAVMMSCAVPKDQRMAKGCDGMACRLMRDLQTALSALCPLRLTWQVLVAFELKDPPVTDRLHHLIPRVDETPQSEPQSFHGSDRIRG